MNTCVLYTVARASAGYALERFHSIIPDLSTGQWRPWPRTLDAHGSRPWPAIMEFNVPMDCSEDDDVDEWGVWHGKPLGQPDSSLSPDPASQRTRLMPSC